MNELKLIKSASFGEVQCDFYGDGKDFYMTRSQVGAGLEYNEPRKVIADIHARHKERLDNPIFSVVRKLRTTDGKSYETYCYTRKGVMEICRWSEQPRANAFMDWAWEVIDSLMRGETKIVSMTDYQKMMAETRQANIRIQKARLLKQIAEQYDGTYKQVLHAYAAKELTGDMVLPLPEINAKTYNATEIGEALGITSHIALGHAASGDTGGFAANEEAQYFAEQLLAPAAVVARLGGHEAKDIAKVCNISKEAAEWREANIQRHLWYQAKYGYTEYDRMFLEQFRIRA